MIKNTTVTIIDELSDFVVYNIIIVSRTSSRSGTVAVVDFFILETLMAAAAKYARFGRYIVYMCI